MADVQFTGTVTRTFAKGIKVAELIKLPNGSSYDRNWTIWTAEPYQEGDNIDVTGVLSVKPNEYTNRDGEIKHTVDYMVNDARIKPLFANTNEAPF